MDRYALNLTMIAVVADGLLSDFNGGAGGRPKHGAARYAPRRQTCGSGPNPLSLQPARDLPPGNRALGESGDIRAQGRAGAGFQTLTE